MRATTIPFDKFLKMLDTWLTCAQQIEYVKMCVKSMHVHTACCFAAVRIMVYTNSMCVPLFCMNYVRMYVHSYILVCTSTHVFLGVSLACTLA